MAQAQEGERAEVEEVLVTGSRIAREGIDSSTPVTVIGLEEIRLSGAPNVEKILSDAPQFVASTNGGASANTVPGGTADVNLRGFGASRNLVLVNGRRFAIYGPEQVTDLNTIPTALIERTEVVTVAPRLCMVPTPSPASSTSSCAMTSKASKPRRRRVTTARRRRRPTTSTSPSAAISPRAAATPWCR